jgi:hypothetical protein
MTPASFRAVCRSPATVFALSETLDDAKPVATTVVNRTYPVLAHRVFGDRSVLILDPIAFKGAPKGRTLFVSSGEFTPYEPRPTDIEILREVARQQTSRYRGDPV